MPSRSIAERLRSLPTPDAAAFYTSGRTSNEAAFLYQLMVRRFGTNNLPDCSNMCHESSGAALAHSIGIGKGSVLLEDIYAADLIMVVGQNPGTNHPRMLSALEEAKKNGAYIVNINPLDEAGLRRFHNPQTPKGLTKGAGPHRRLPPGAALRRPGAVRGDGEADGRGRGGRRGVRGQLHLGVRRVRRVPRQARLGRRTHRDRADPRRRSSGSRRRYRESDRVIVCWAMGLTQHKGAVATIQEITNLMLLRGNIGKRGAGLCPVRGHSNVQGDRTMGVWEKAHDVVARRACVTSSASSPTGSTGSTRSTRCGRCTPGKVKAFFAVGGNFVSATPDTTRTEEAMRGLDLTVHVSTKLNRSHAVAGREALILPCLGRTERDTQVTGEQVVTVEDSMGMVHASRGRLEPGVAAPALRGRDRHPARRGAVARRQLGHPVGRVPRRLLRDP